MNSIEVISETSLVSESNVRWQLIDVPKNILSPRYRPAVAPLNESEIAILGGFDDDENKLSDVVIFNTTTKKCKKVTDGGNYKFMAYGN